MDAFNGLFWYDQILQGWCNELYQNSWTDITYDSTLKPTVHVGGSLTMGQEVKEYGVIKFKMGAPQDLPIPGYSRANITKIEMKFIIEKLESWPGKDNSLIPMIAIASFDDLTPKESLNLQYWGNNPGAAIPAAPASDNTITYNIELADNAEDVWQEKGYLYIYFIPYDYTGDGSIAFNPIEIIGWCDWIHDPLAIPPSISIYTGQGDTGWQQAIPYIYTGKAEGWKQATPYIYDGSQWKSTS